MTALQAECGPSAADRAQVVADLQAQARFDPWARLWRSYSFRLDAATGAVRPSNEKGARDRLDAQAVSRGTAYQGYRQLVLVYDVKGLASAADLQGAGALVNGRCACWSVL
jgi:hypothetical protein